MNKPDKNKDKPYVEKVVIDLVINKILKIYRYYPDENGKHNIPNCHN